MRVYFLVIFAVVLFATVFGLLAPLLISTKDTFAVICGLALVVITPPCLFIVINRIFIKKVKK
ncbi:hypothetical protein [Trabulsiella odontotermitis]|uniref:hypothetical protein n=1 Tax=Trabulsiella odontotermitis TaxID=379893 RepID=UPI000675DC18|nr:hypothetical protein [Trabulsiella odontotermitis]